MPYIIKNMILCAAECSFDKMEVSDSFHDTSDVTFAVQTVLSYTVRSSYVQCRH
jgi:hypothetical protein